MQFILTSFCFNDIQSIIHQNQIVTLREGTKSSKCEGNDQRLLGIVYHLEKLYFATYDKFVFSTVLELEPMLAHILTAVKDKREPLI